MVSDSLGTLSESMLSDKDWLWSSTLCQRGHWRMKVTWALTS